MWTALKFSSHLGRETAFINTNTISPQKKPKWKLHACMHARTPTHRSVHCGMGAFLTKTAWGRVKILTLQIWIWDSELCCPWTQPIIGEAGILTLICRIPKIIASLVSLFWLLDRTSTWRMAKEILKLHCPSHYLLFTSPCVGWDLICLEVLVILVA